jgi:hypothetical protein
MKNRRGEADAGCFAVIGLVVLVGFVTALYGYTTGWEAGVRDAVAGNATVIDKPDGTTEAVKVVKKEAMR